MGGVSGKARPGFAGRQGAERGAERKWAVMVGGVLGPGWVGQALLGGGHGKLGEGAGGFPSVAQLVERRTVGR